MPIRLAVALAILMGLLVAVSAATTITVIQRGLALDRASVSLVTGDRLNFTNDDDVIHNIHIFGPGSEENVACEPHLRLLDRVRRWVDGA